MITSACSSLPPVNQDHPYTKLTESNFQDLNGAYKIISKDTSYRNLSYSLLQNDQYRPEPGDRIELNMVDVNQVKISLYQNDTIIDGNIIKGKLENGYFELKNLLKFHLYMGVFTGYSEQKTRIRLDPNNNLLVDTAGSGCAFLIFIPIICSETENYNLKFERIN